MATPAQNRKFHLLDGRKKKSSLPSVGNKVMVDHDPISCEQPEGLATITEVINETGWNDAAANMMYRCNVRFMGGHTTCERDVSLKAG